MKHGHMNAKYWSNISYNKLLENIKYLLLKISFLDFSSSSTKPQLHVKWTDIIVIHFPDDKNRHSSQYVRSLTVHRPDMAASLRKFNGIQSTLKL
jgi:hypothetical protein